MNHTPAPWKVSHGRGAVLTPSRGPAGLGFLQDRGNVTKEQVWERSLLGHDNGFNAKTEQDGEVYADYTFGRMMKVGFKWSNNEIDVREDSPRNDYQAWSRTYPTYEALINEAIKNYAKTQTTQKP